jgi:hypothetical protein
MTAIIVVQKKSKEQNIVRPGQTLLEAGPLRQVYVMRPVLESANDQLQTRSAGASGFKKLEIRKDMDKSKLKCMYVVEVEKDGKSLTCSNVEFLGRSELKTSIEDGTVTVCGNRHDVLRYRVYMETRDAILVTM